MTTENKVQIDSLYGLLEKLLPIWAAQIQASRSITDESITHLSQLFYGLAQRIQTTVALKSQNQSIGALIAIFQESQFKQQKMIESSMDERLALTGAITNLSAFAISDTESKNTHALNPELHEAILYAVELAKSYERKEAAMLSQYEHLQKQLAEKLSAFTHDLSNQTERLNIEGQHISKDISDVLVSLQFQDRVNQMLAHVNNDLNKLDTALKGVGADINAEGWISDFAKAYVMQEQHDIHNQVFGTVTAGAGSSSSSDEITFF